MHGVCCRRRGMDENSGGNNFRATVFLNDNFSFLNEAEFNRTTVLQNGDATALESCSDDNDDDDDGADDATPSPKAELQNESKPNAGGVLDCEAVSPVRNSLRASAVITQSFEFLDSIDDFFSDSDTDDSQQSVSESNCSLAEKLPEATQSNTSVENNEEVKREETTQSSDTSGCHEPAGIFVPGRVLVYG